MAVHQRDHVQESNRFGVLDKPAFDVFIRGHLGDGVEIAQWFKIRKCLTKQIWLEVPILGHEFFHGQSGDVGEGLDHLKGLYLGDLSITGIIRPP